MKEEKLCICLSHLTEIFKKFGEIYFATVSPGVVKGWHLHKTQEQNYCVIKGMIKSLFMTP